MVQVTASAVSPNDALKSGSGKHTARAGLFRPLVAAQTAFSFVVLFVAGLFLASFSKLVQTDLGFDRHNLAIVNVEARELRQGGPNAMAAWAQLLDRLRELPGVQSASLSGWGLFEGSRSSQSLRIPGRAVEAFENYYLPVSPGFLETMRIRLLDGRDFEWRDALPESPSAVIVNKSFARRYFPGESPLGKRFSYVGRGNMLVAQELSGFFSIVAIVLVAVGLYGVLSYSVVQRTREIGIRLALGSRPSRVVGLVLSEVTVVTAIGLAVGVAGGIAASRFITALLYQVKPSDVWSLATPLVCLLLACVLSAVVPAVRATRVDPMTALRYE